MEEKKVDIYPVIGVQVRYDPDRRVTIVHLPHVRGFGTPDQQEVNDRAYALMPEQARLLRDYLNDAIRRLATPTQ